MTRRAVLADIQLALWTPGAVSSPIIVVNLFVVDDEIQIQLRYDEK